MSLCQNNLNTLWASLMVEELIRLGVEYFFLSPGSRCAPLTVAIARHKRAKILKSFDERSLGFCALGASKARQKPSVIVVTSATAVANLMPAIVEASMDRVPLIILTADRPFELRNTGANQAIDQVKIFGGYVREFIDIPTPSTQISPAFILRSIDQIYLKSLAPYPGPVHVNCMFREPLEPDFIESFDENYLDGLSFWLKQNKPMVKNYTNALFVNIEEAKEITYLINHAERGLLVVGAIRDKKTLMSILDLGKKLNWPIVADVNSALRFYKDGQIIHYADQLLLHKDFSNQSFDVVLQFGGYLVSKRLQKFLEKHREKPFIFVDNYFERQDPNCIVTHRVHSDVNDFCRQVTCFIRTDSKLEKMGGWQLGSKYLEKMLEENLDNSNVLSEPFVARFISSQIDRSPRNLFLSTSMPIRDMDMYAKPSTAILGVVTNRGASGIDGILSTAIGFTHVSQKPMTLIVGDLTFLHDSNGLSFLSQISSGVTIVVINNQGGGIFSFLPIAKSVDVFRDYFTTSHEHCLEGVSQTFFVKHIKVTNVHDFKEAYLNAISKNEHGVIEVMSNADENYRFHETLKQKIIDQIERYQNDKFNME